MRTFASLTPNPRFPSARITYAVLDAPTPPPPPAVPWVISGVVSRSGTVTPGIPIVFTSLGTITTDGLGAYSQSAANGYTGTATPYYSVGSFTPASRSYSTLSANSTSQNYDFYVTPGTENVLLTRPGAFALNFTASTTTGYFAVQDETGTITIYPSREAAVLDFSNLTCHLWPCFSATDAYNTGHLTLIAAGGVQGLQGDLDVSGLTELAELDVQTNQITSLNVTGCVLLTQLYASNCLMGVSELNAVLIQLDNNGALNGAVSLVGQGTPTGGGATAKTSLRNKGWLVDTD